MAIEVTDQQLEALRRNPLFANISGDLSVTADMAAHSFRISVELVSSLFGRSSVSARPCTR